MKHGKNIVKKYSSNYKDDQIDYYLFEKFYARFYYGELLAHFIGFFLGGIVAVIIHNAIF